MKNLTILLIFLLNTITVFSQTGHWDSIPTKRNPGFRYDHGMAPIGDKQVLVFGGTWHSVMNDTWLFDLKDSSWTKIETIHTPPARDACEMVQISKNEVLLYGGIDDYSYEKNDTWIFSLEQNDWTEVLSDTVGPNQSRFAMSLLNKDTVILATGGFNFSLSSIWYFDLRTRNWTTDRKWGIAKVWSEPNSTQIKDGVVVFCCGYNLNERELPYVYEYKNGRPWKKRN